MSTKKNCICGSGLVCPSHGAPDEIYKNPFSVEELQAYADYVNNNLDRIERGGWTPVCLEEFLDSEELFLYLPADTITVDSKDLIELLRGITNPHATEFLVRESQRIRDGERSVISRLFHCYYEQGGARV
jgi:hypothetical protein